MLCAYEGMVGHVYMDQAGYPTIGYGHKLTSGEVTSGKYHGVTITAEEAMELCRRDVSRFEDAVGKLVTVPLSQNQYDALTDFAYNLGAGALATSTLLKRLNAGDYVGAASEFVRFDHIGKREDAGLKGRREGEARLFLEGMPSVGGPTLDDILRMAENQQIDLRPDVLSPMRPEDRDTAPDIAALKAREPNAVG